MAVTDAAPAAGLKTAAALPNTRAARWGAWLLAISPAYFVLIVVVTAATLASAIGLGSFDDITREQMDAIAPGWIAENILFPLSFIVGSVGVGLLAGSLLRLGGAARGWAWSAIGAAACAVLLFLPYAPLRIAAMAFTTETLGEDPLYAAWDTAGLIALDLAIVALPLLCLAVFSATRHRTAAVLIGALGLVCLLAQVLLLPIPPFVISFLWCALGIVWLRGIRSARRRTAPLE